MYSQCELMFHGNRGVVHVFASFFCITESGDKERSPEVTVCYIRRAKEVVTW